VKDDNTTVHDSGKKVHNATVTANALAMTSMMVDNNKDNNNTGCPSRNQDAMMR